MCRWAIFAAATILIVGLSAAASLAQTSPSSTDSSASIRGALQLAKTGHCPEGDPVLRRSIARMTDRALKYEAEFAIAQCSMSLNRVSLALEDLARLNRDFPRDPEVLYVTAHYCSQLASSASQELADKAPASYQAQELDAESYEAHGKWEDAMAEYKKVLEQYPNLPGIHYRLGRIILSMPSTPTTPEDARSEFEAELKIDPNNAAAEFMLGDLARQLQQWDDAIEHFSRAAKLDVGFLEAYLGLGMALNAEGKYADAVNPLTTYVKGAPDDPAGHYQLAMAYARTGHRDEATRELARQRELDAKVNKDNRKPADTQAPQTPQQ
jgi:tetratricopeptide (TPR) repeat protein